MKKATQKAAAPVSLGTKRSCPKCGAKFYDFGKEELSCPKCEHTWDQSSQPAIPLKLETKKKKDNTESALMESEEVEVASESEDFESLEDLEEDEDDVDVDVDDEKEDF